jgi:hypothetical protein
VNQIIIKVSLFFLLLGSFSTQAQVISSKIIDSITKDPVPFATIIFKKRGMVSNEEGRFSFLFKKDAIPTDTLMISCIGFETIAKPLNQFKDSVIYLIPKITELSEVVLTSKQYTVKEIIKKVKEGINKNYNFDLTKKRIFFRETNHQKFVKNNYKLKKSTIDALNERFLDSALQSIPKKNSYYSEVLCDMYGNFNRENQKVKLIKASELYDKNNRVGLTALEEKFKKIIDKNVKPDSYFKIKSGWFGQKLDMDELRGIEIDSTSSETLKRTMESERKREVEREKFFSKFRRKSLENTMGDIFFKEKSKLNFIRKSGRYDFKLLDLTFLGDATVYVISFVPKGSADYKGIFYVNYDDFAIIRVDYENVRPVKNFKLLGVSFIIHLSKGKMIFSKGKDERYSLQYLEKEDANRFGIKRPLKIIEKNKNVRGRRKQNELYVKLDMAITSANKFEVVVFNIKNVTTSEFESVTEDNRIKPTYMPAYDPKFWKGYNIIEPNQAIKDFKIVE